ncbi:Hsp20/alpha crystallin family protein [Bdellovibrio bacteriovorus]|uniref:Hsp20/alpha crystallin family protein n=1 Tax=Bdellovibrio bacteriovorus TaxID=959 RepID=UPI0021CF06B3|nr:Hsp20/alpha crystallin family protein [Bdellovibrio bacteriovorus]UXR64074.1 Hsp20/alpha crystallin family protein [Bdellovibrio bacteriovorus]
MRLLTPYWPTRRATTSLFDEMDRLFENFAVPASYEAYERTLNPACEVSETQDHYLLSMDIPGFKKENVNIEVNGNLLTISGERKREEKVMGTFTRRFTVPNSVDGGKIEAHHEDGVLSIYLPKTPVAQAKKIEIQSQGGFFERLGLKPAAEDNKSEPSH